MKKLLMATLTMALLLAGTAFAGQKAQESLELVIEVDENYSISLPPTATLSLPKSGWAKNHVIVSNVALYADSAVTLSISINSTKMTDSISCDFELVVNGVGTISTRDQPK